MFSEISHYEYLGHVNSFMQAGIHTTKTAICHLLLRLAVNKDVQEKLRHDIDNLTERKRDIKYEDFEHLPYLDNVIAGTYIVYRRFPVNFLYFCSSRKLKSPNAHGLNFSSLIVPFHLPHFWH